VLQLHSPRIEHILKTWLRRGASQNNTPAGSGSPKFQREKCNSRDNAEGFFFFYGWNSMLKSFSCWALEPFPAPKRKEVYLHGKLATAKQQSAEAKKILVYNQ
jgi:hypothetical protein